MNYKILFIVPTLDSYHLLPTLVRSLESQVSVAWRVLFVDGPSSSNHRSWLIAQCNRDSRFSYVEQLTSEKQIFGAMNQGFSHALPDEPACGRLDDERAKRPNQRSADGAGSASDPARLKRY